MPGGKKSTPKLVAKKNTRSASKKIVATPKPKRPTVRRAISKSVAKPVSKRAVKRKVERPVVKAVRPPVLTTPLPQPVVVQLDSTVESSVTTSMVRTTPTPHSWGRLLTVVIITAGALGAILMMEDKTLLIVDEVADVPTIIIPAIDWSTTEYTFKLGQCQLATPINWTMNSTTDTAVTWLDINHPSTTITMALYESTSTVVDWLKQYQTPYFFDTAKQAVPALSERHGLLFMGRNGSGDPVEILYWSNQQAIIEVLVTNPNISTNATILNDFVQDWNCTTPTEITKPVQ